MSRVTIKEWYQRVAATWPEREFYPAMTAIEAVRAGKRLYRFSTGRTFLGRVHVATGNRSNWIRRGVMTVNPSRGWKNLVHDLSHYAHRIGSDARPHGGEHARMEIRCIKEVLRRGWLDGKLRDAAKPRRDLPLERHGRILARIATWERKAKRAQTALRKLRRQAAYYARKAAA